MNNLILVLNSVFVFVFRKKDFFLCMCYSSIYYPDNFTSDVTHLTKCGKW